MPEEDAPDDETLDEQPDADELEAQLRRAPGNRRAQADRRTARTRPLAAAGQQAGQPAGGAVRIARTGLRPSDGVHPSSPTRWTFLRTALLRQGGLRLMCFSGRGGEIPSTDGTAWRKISRDDAKRRFRNGEADVLLCTDAAAEGLNFQFCGALVNYDMPWNPMRVEQRIGRIDRLGQRHPNIRIVNLHYEDTVETDVYRRCGSAFNCSRRWWCRLQPILAQLPPHHRQCGAHQGHRHGHRQGREPSGPCGCHSTANAGRPSERLRHRRRPKRGLGRGHRPAAFAPVANHHGRLGPHSHHPRPHASRCGAPNPRNREYGLRMAGMEKFVRVTTDPAYFEENAESLELWSPGNPLFQAPEMLAGGGGAAGGNDAAGSAGGVGMTATLGIRARQVGASPLNDAAYGLPSASMNSCSTCCTYPQSSSVIVGWQGSMMPFS